MFCNCQRIINLSPEGQKLTKTLENLTVLFSVIAFIKLFLGDFNGFINDILMTLFLVMTFMQASFIMAIWTIFMLILNSFYVFVFVLLRIQDWFLGIVFIENGFATFYVFIMYISAVLYILLIRYTFLAYREYKALFYEQRGVDNGYSNLFFYFFKDLLMI